MNILGLPDYRAMLIPFREDGRRKVCKIIRDRLIAGGISPQEADKYTELPYEDSEQERARAIYEQQEADFAEEIKERNRILFEEAFIESFIERHEAMRLSRKEQLIADGVSEDEAEQMTFIDWDNHDIQQRLSQMASEVYKERLPYLEAKLKAAGHLN